MAMFIPNFLTVFGLLSLASLLMTYVLWIFGRQYWCQGTAYLLSSTIIYALAYATFSLFILNDAPMLHVLASILLSLGLSVYTLAVQNFRYSFHLIRDVTILAVPLLCLILSAFLYMPDQVVKFNLLHGLICLSQMLYILYLFYQLRARTVGRGWSMLIGSFAVEIAIVCFWILSLSYLTRTPDQSLVASGPVAIWLLIVFLSIKTIMNNLCFLIMLAERKQLLAHLQSHLDYLCDLPKNADLIATLKQLNKDKSLNSNSYTVMLVDLDHFDQLVQRHGHQVADQAIQQIANTLQHECRITDMLTLYQHKTFALLLMNTSLQGAELMAQRLCQRIQAQELVLSPEQSINITISIGVHCCRSEHQHSSHHILKAAQTALYKAKQRGRNNFVIFTPSMLQTEPQFSKTLH